MNPYYRAQSDLAIMFGRRGPAAAAVCWRFSTTNHAPGRVSPVPTRPPRRARRPGADVGGASAAADHRRCRSCSPPYRGGSRTAGLAHDVIVARIQIRDEALGHAFKPEGQIACNGLVRPLASEILRLLAYQIP